MRQKKLTSEKMTLQDLEQYLWRAAGMSTSGSSSNISIYLVTLRLQSFSSIKSSETAPEYFRASPSQIGSKGKTPAMGILVVMISPVAIDGFLQLLTSYESTNLLRFLTGIPFGIVVGCIIGALTLSILAE